VINNLDLNAIYIAGPGHGGPGMVANTYLEGTYTELYLDLIVACVIGDGEAETGPLATSWHSNKFLDPARDGARAADPAPERLRLPRLYGRGR
jgi:phosphoketolase